MWHNVRRSPYQALAAILIIMQTFFVISIFTFVITGSSRIITYFESLPKVTAFFKDDAKQADIDQIQNKIQQTGKVSTIHFVSKQEALQKYKSFSKDDPRLMDLVSADILPSSLEVSTTQINDLQSVSDILQSSPIVSKVLYQKDVVDTLTSWTNAIRKIGIALIVILALDSIFIMLIIISIKVSQKREDIEIMRLIGATKWYIRWPFLYEGVFYGIVGTIPGWALAVVSLIYAEPFLKTFLGDIPLFTFSPAFFLIVLAGELLLAFVLGMFSSFLAVLRYLK